MLKKHFSITAFALLSALLVLSGCTEPKPKTADETDILRAYKLPAGWAMEEQQAEGSVAVFVFSNDELICKLQVMGGSYASLSGSFTFVFVEKWAEQDYEENEKAFQKYSQCMEKYPAPNPATASVPPGQIMCGQESGLRSEPDFNSKNYSVYATKKCDETGLFEKIKEDLQNFE